MVSKETPYLTIARAVSLLGEGGEQALISAHVRGDLTLVGRRRSGSELSPDIAIPRETFAARVRFNLRENSIEPEPGGSVSRGVDTDGQPWEFHETTPGDFAEFEHAWAQSQWECVKVAEHELRALKESCNTEGGSTTSAPNDLGFAPSPKSHNRRRGRPKGSGSFAEQDAPLLEEARLLIQHEGHSKKRALSFVATKAAGGGQPASKQKRLEKRYSEKFPP